MMLFLNGCGGCRRQASEVVMPEPIPAQQESRQPESTTSADSTADVGHNAQLKSSEEKPTESEPKYSIRLPSGRNRATQASDVNIKLPQISDLPEIEPLALSTNSSVNALNNTSKRNSARKSNSDTTVNITTDAMPVSKIDTAERPTVEPLGGSIDESTGFTGPNNQSPVRTTSPVHTVLPVNTESPVKENQPIRKVPTQGLDLTRLSRSVLLRGVAAAVTCQLGATTPSVTIENSDLPSDKTDEKPTDKPSISVPDVPPPANTSKPTTGNSVNADQADSTSVESDITDNQRPAPPLPDPPVPGPPRPESNIAPNAASDVPSDRRERRPDFDSRRSNGDSRRNDQEASSSEPKKLRFNFRYAPWKDVIEWFADQAELSLQADNVPTGSLNLMDNNAYTPTEALDVLNSYLLIKEYTIIRKGKSLFVIFLPDGIPPNLLEPITPNQLDDRGKYELCRCVFSLTRTTPDVVQLEIEKLLGPQGSIVPLPKSQQILVTETAGTLRAIRDIIKKIDDPNDMSSAAIHIIETKNLSADEALGIMRKLLGIDENDQSLRTVVDISGKKIYLTGRGDMIELAKEIIKTIDESFDSKEVELVGRPQFEVYDVGSADPQTVLAVLQTMLAGTPDVRLSVDAKTGGIAALGRLADHATIRETIRQMQLNIPTVEVFYLKFLSPASAVDSIRKFFATATISNSSASTSSNSKQDGVQPPTVEANVSNRQIIVRGTRSQIAQIRELLEKLGEDGTAGRPRSQETIRPIVMSPSAAALVLDQLKEIWPKLEPNEIRVSQPSAMVPMRSTSDLKPKVPAPQALERQQSDVDELIDKTFRSQPNIPSNPSSRLSPQPRFDGSTIIGPTTIVLPPTQFLTVQYTQMRTLDDTDKTSVQPEDHLPIYEPISAEDSSSIEVSEIELLKRQIDELKNKLNSLEQNDVKTSNVDEATNRPETPTSNQSTVQTESQPTIPEISKQEIKDAVRRWLEEHGQQPSQATDPTVKQFVSEGHSAEPIAPSEPIRERPAPVIVSTGPNGLMISSDDPEALDRLEDLIRMLSDETVLGKTSLVVYYLKNSTAEVVSQTLQTLMGSSGSTTTFGVSGSGSVDMSTLLEGEQRTALLGILQIGNSIEKTGPLSIAADSRLNALLIQANPVDHKTIERLLPILDQDEIPGGDIERNPKPRFIRLENMRAEDALEAVEKIYASRIQSGTTGGGNQQVRGNQNQRQQGGRQNNMPGMMPGMMSGGPGMMPGGPGAMMLQMMSRMGNQSSSTTKEQEATMTLGVDSRSNSLIVSAPKSLFNEVETYVKELDQYALMMQTVVEPMYLGEVSSDIVRQSLTNLLGDSVKFSTTQSSQQRSGFGSNQQRGGFSGFGGMGTNRGNTNPFMGILQQGGFGGNQQRGGFGSIPGGMGGFGGNQQRGGFGGVTGGMGGMQRGGFGGR